MNLEYVLISDSRYISFVFIAEAYFLHSLMELQYQYSFSTKTVKLKSYSYY